MTKTNGCLLLLVLLLTSSFSIPVNQTLKINITRLRNDKGVVLVSLFKGGKGYPDDANLAVRKEKTGISNKTAVVYFVDLPAGNYAAAILHDENSNQKMDKTFLGLPKEGYGFSNNVSGAFGPPSFNRAAFTHSGSGLTSIEIRARY
jgi:uncharacterized protein (DUF2141 family)